MFRRVRFLLVALVAVAVPVPAQAQMVERCDRDPDEHWRLACQYAPIYWFAAEERYYPTIPFFTAFDSVDNVDDDGDGEIDFEDLDEIAAASLDDRAYWNWLDSLYLDYESTRVHSARPLRSAIFFRVRPLDRSDVRDMWRYLQSDEQVWTRFHKGVLEDRSVRDTATFQVIEYYAYYLNDWGLVGHRYDVEPVFVFMPQDPTLAESFRIIVAAGHTGRIPNNVLVLSGARAKNQLEKRLNILVELGDHSSAADLSPHGVFNPGLDANWHIEDLWGTRDVQATAARGFTGQYQSWMMFPRDSMEVVRIFPPGFEGRVGQLAGEADKQGRPATAFTYSLIPVSLFDTLSNELDKVNGSSDTIASLVREISQRLEWDVPPLEGLSNDQLDRMRGWKSFSSHEKHQIWRSRHYRGRSTRLFKHHLFRPALTELSLARLRDNLRLLSYWITAYPGDALSVQGGFIFPVIEGLPVRLPGYLEVHAGVYMRCTNLARGSCYNFAPKSFSASVVWDRHYSRMFSYYAQLTWVPERKAVDGDPEAADWTVSVGPSLLLLLGPKKAPLFPHALRVRVGYRLDCRNWRLRFDRSGWEIQLSAAQ